MASSNNRYLDSIQRAVALMETSLTDEVAPSLEQLAGAANLSRFHFHRIYRLLTGETCQQTFIRLKLTKAAFVIQANKSSITDIAFDVGYGSSQALAKALKRHANTSASQLRKEPERLAATIEFLSRPSNHEQITPAVCVELVSVNPMTVMAINTGKPYPQLNKVFEQLFVAAGGPENVEAILGMPGTGTACLTDENNTFDCALLTENPVSPLPSPCVIKEVNPGLCVRTRHQGSFENLDTSIDKLYCYLLTLDDVIVSDKPCLLHYLDDPEQVEEAFLRTDIYLPINSPP